MDELKSGDPIIVLDLNALSNGEPLKRCLFAGELEPKTPLLCFVAFNGHRMTCPRDQVFPDSYNGRARLYESISEKIGNLERQKTIVVNEMRDLEHAWASAEEGKDYGCINSHEFDDPMLVKTGENHPHDDVELCPECGAEDIHKN